MSKSQNLNPVPNPEVKEPGSKVKRRKHTAEYKLRVLKEADMCRGEAGSTAALLRKEGLYSSNLTEWRKQRDSGALSIFSKKRGAKAKYGPKDREMEHLRGEVKRLEEKLRQANLIIEVQKKISAILEIPSALEKEGRGP